MYRSTTYLRSFAILFVATLVVAMPFFAQSAPSMSMGDKLTHKDLTRLIATAKTPAEHRRIATYYRAQADSYAEQAREHEAMIAAYKANPGYVNEKTQEATVGHCTYFVNALNALAGKARDLAAVHEQMAVESAK